MDRWKQLSANEMTLLDHVFWSSRISREALASGSSFSKSRANAAVAGLLEQGVLEPTGERQPTGGRRAGTLRLSRGLGVLVGVALGATGLEVGILAPDLELLAHHSEPADVRDGPAAVLTRVRTLMRELLKRAGVRVRDVIAIGRIVASDDPRHRLAQPVCRERVTAAHRARAGFISGDDPRQVEDRS